VKDQVFRSILSRVFKVLLITQTQRVRCFASEDRPNGFDVVKLVNARFPVSAPEIQPIGQTTHMQSRNPFGGNNTSDVVFKTGQFDPVVSQKIKQHIARSEPIEITAACRQIDLRFHSSPPFSGKQKIPLPFGKRTDDTASLQKSWYNQVLVIWKISFPVPFQSAGFLARGKKRRRLPAFAVAAFA
jgi:hypothetical protein